MVLITDAWKLRAREFLSCLMSSVGLVQYFSANGAWPPGGNPPKKQSGFVRLCENYYSIKQRILLPPLPTHLTFKVKHFLSTSRNIHTNDMGLSWLQVIHLMGLWTFLTLHKGLPIWKGWETVTWIRMGLGELGFDPASYTGLECELGKASLSLRFCKMGWTMFTPLPHGMCKA